MKINSIFAKIGGKIRASKQKQKATYFFEGDDTCKVTSSSYKESSIDDITLKRHISCVYKNIEDKKLNPEYYAELKARIARAKEKSIENKMKNGIVYDEQDMSVEVDDIRNFINEKIRQREEHKEAIKRNAKINEIMKKKAMREQQIKKEQMEKQLEEQKKIKKQQLKQERIARKMEKKMLAKEKKGKKPLYTTIPLVGALAATTITIGTSVFRHFSNKPKDFSAESTGYSVTLVPKVVKVEKAPTIILNENSNDENNKNSNDKNMVNSSSDMGFEDNNIEEEILQETVGSEEILQETVEPVVFNIGDKIVVEEELEYTANCKGGGKKNKIGNVSWRPAGDYYVEKIAFVHGKDILGIMNRGDNDIRKHLEDCADKYDIDIKDINTSVLLSLAPDTCDTGWANISIDEIEKSMVKMEIDVDNEFTKKEQDLDLER